VALVVGSLLFAINHGSAVLRGEMTRERWLRLFTYLVPYMSVFMDSTQPDRDTEFLPAENPTVGVMKIPSMPQARSNSTS